MCVLVLRVETGSYVGEQASERICILFNQAFMEDEIHFLLNCPFHKKLHENELGIDQNDVFFSNKCDYDKLSTLLIQLC